MDATKTILYKEYATLDWEGEDSVVIYSGSYTPLLSKDYVFVEVRQYISTDKTEVITESTVRVDDDTVAHSVKVEEVSAQIDAYFIREGIKLFDRLLEDHPASHAKNVRRFHAD